MKQKWTRGHISRFWNIDDIKKFDYVRQPLMDSEIETWKSKGYDYVKSFSGSMYDSRNPMPEWVKRFDKIFDLKNMTYNFYKMQQLEIMPEHVDHFQTYMKLFDVEYENAVRILVMLEDWKPGHYLEVDGVGIVNWVAGDYFMWDSDVPHAASNIGTQDRYTLQITGSRISFEDISKLHWYNIPGLVVKKESLNAPVMANMYKKMAKKTPYYIYMYNREIPELEAIKHDQETIDKLNDIGVEIYIYEPLCSYRKDDQQMYPPHGTVHSLIFYSEFHYDQVQQTDDLRAVELDSIERYVENNKLTNVTVKTCDYNIEKFYTYYGSKMKLEADDLFVKFFDLREFEDLESEDENMGRFTKKFISMNWRYTPHRQLVASYLANHDTDSYLTWYFKSDMSTVSVEPWYSIHEWIRKNPHVFQKMISGFNKLNSKSPWNVDLKVNEHTLISDKYFKKMFPTGMIYDHKIQSFGDNKDRLKNVYSDVFVDVVNESRFAQPTANYSEKVLRPMFYKKPFILVAPPHTLHYLKMQGFESFSEFWDESYDAMEDHESRLFAIFKLIDRINRTPINELQDMYQKMLPILEHNRKLLLEKCTPRERL